MSSHVVTLLAGRQSARAKNDLSFVLNSQNDLTPMYKSLNILDIFRFTDLREMVKF